MFHSEGLARAIHDDRVRQIERATRDRLLLQEPDEVGAAARITGNADASPRVSARVARVDPSTAPETAWRTPA